MPFKSHAQETYLRENEPATYRKWVRKYGHYKGKAYHMKAGKRKRKKKVRGWISRAVKKNS